MTYWVIELDRGQSYVINKGFAVSSGQISRGEATNAKVGDNLHVFNKIWSLMIRSKRWQRRWP